MNGNGFCCRSFIIWATKQSIRRNEHSIHSIQTEMCYYSLYTVWGTTNYESGQKEEPEYGEQAKRNSHAVQLCSVGGSVVAAVFMRNDVNYVRYERQQSPTAIKKNYSDVRSNRWFNTFRTVWYVVVLLLHAIHVGFVDFSCNSLDSAIEHSYRQRIVLVSFFFIYILNMNSAAKCAPLFAQYSFCRCLVI